MEGFLTRVETFLRMPLPISADAIRESFDTSNKIMIEWNKLGPARGPIPRPLIEFVVRRGELERLLKSVQRDQEKRSRLSGTRKFKFAAIENALVDLRRRRDAAQHAPTRMRLDAAIVATQKELQRLLTSADDGRTAIECHVERHIEAQRKVRALRAELRNETDESRRLEIAKQISQTNKGKKNHE